MFSKRERLPRAQFGTALKTHKRLSSPHFLLLIPNEDIRGYAVVIPKKIIRLSSTRHRLKRQILEALRAISLPPSLIVFPRSTVHSVSYKDMTVELHTLLSKIDLK